MDLLYEENGRLDLIVGGTGSGKTATSFKIAEELYDRGEEIWWYGVPTELPEFFHYTLDWDAIPAGVTVIVDEASVQFLNRQSGGSRQISYIRMLPIQRHQDKNFIVVTQSTNISDVNFYKLADSVIFKEYSMFQDDEERIDLPDQLKIFMPTRRPETLYLDSDNLYIFEHGLADCWKPSYSKPYAEFETEAEKYRFVLELLEHRTDHEIKEQARLRGGKIPLRKIMFIRMLAETREHDELLNMPDGELVELVKNGYSDDPLQDVVRNETEGKNYDFELMPIQEAQFDRKKKREEDFELYSELNYNRKMEEELRRRVVRQKNLIISIFGETGSGKSYAGLSMGKLLNEIFKDEKNVDGDLYYFFRTQDILENLKKMSAGDVVIMDEQVGTTGSGSHRRRTQLKAVEETLRADQINFIFIAPGVRTHKHHFILEMGGIDYENGVSKALVWTKNQDLLGYITLRKPPENIVDEYEEANEKFRESIRKQDTDREGHIKKKARKMIKNDDLAVCESKKEKLTILADEYDELTNSEVDKVLNWLEIWRKKGELDEQREKLENEEK